jgi:chromosome segregation ATPase
MCEKENMGMIEHKLNLIFRMNQSLIERIEKLEEDHCAARPEQLLPVDELIDEMDDQITALRDTQSGLEEEAGLLKDKIHNLEGLLANLKIKLDE